MCPLFNHFDDVIARVTRIRPSASTILCNDYIKQCLENFLVRRGSADLLVMSPVAARGAGGGLPASASSGKRRTASNGNGSGSGGGSGGGSSSTGKGAGKGGGKSDKGDGSADADLNLTAGFVLTGTSASISTSSPTKSSSSSSGSGSGSGSGAKSKTLRGQLVDTHTPVFRRACISKATLESYVSPCARDLMQSGTDEKTG